MRWPDRLSGLLSSWRLDGPPREVRKRLRGAFAPLASDPPPGASRFLLLVFGSVARGEPATDLDLLLVIDGEAPWLIYRACRWSGLAVDLNLASAGWLQEAWQDAEWGYWLTEAYVLAVGDEALEAQWRHAANRFASASVRRHRIREYGGAWRGLIAAAGRAAACGRPLTARLLLHEAARAGAVAAIDFAGTRLFSHRSLPGEMVHSCRRADVPTRTVAALGAALWGDARRAAPARRRYRAIRGRLSALLRRLDVEAWLDFRRSARWCDRLAALSRAADAPAGLVLERQLALIGADEWLPACEVEGVSRALEELRERLVSRRSPPLAAQLGRDLQQPIQNAGLAGVRWCEFTGNRLKLILSTGGCRTPSCAFCALPAYGAATARHEPALAVAAALRRYAPTELALYNDGSLFNAAEISNRDLAAVARAVAAAAVQRLWVESTPRFVTRARVAELRSCSAVESLVVAMGFQAHGDWFAVARLGRPDVDALFDRAVDEIHEAGAVVRLYLLWGFGGFGLEVWRERLSGSLAWAAARGVEQVTICPYVPVRQGQHGVPFPILCSLRETLAATAPGRTTAVSVSVPERPSCGPAPDLGWCPTCRDCLVRGTWHERRGKPPEDQRGAVAGNARKLTQGNGWRVTHPQRGLRS